MKNITFKKLSENSKIGTLYKVFYTNSENPIEIELKNTRTLFGIEYRYNTKYIKWVLDYKEKELVNALELCLRSSYEDNSNIQIKSKIISKPNYPLLLETKIGNNIKCSNDLIKHEPGELTSFKDICKNEKYNIKGEIKNISIKEDKKDTYMYYNIEINEIEKCVNS